MRHCQPLIFALVFTCASLTHAESYLSPVDGDGTDLNHFRSRCLGQGKGKNIDIRPDVTVATGYMVCPANPLPANMTGVVVMGTSLKTTLTTKVKSDIQAATGLAVKGTSAEDALKELVIPTLPVKLKGDYEILIEKDAPPLKTAATLSNDVYYRGLLAASAAWGRVLAARAWQELQPAMAWATTLTTETFNCADSSSIGTCIHTWVTKASLGSWDIVSNRASATGTTQHVDYANATLATYDHEVSATVVSATLGSGTSTACSVLGRTTADNTLTYYRTAAVLASSGSLNEVVLVRTVTNTSTSLATDTTDWANNDIIAIRMIGTTISSRKNDVEILSVTDGTICDGCSSQAGKYGGMRHVAQHATGNCVMDNWNALDIGSSVFGPLRRRF